MPTIPLYAPSKPTSPVPSPLPHLLQTPSGLAILEIQGTINTPSLAGPDPTLSSSSSTNPSQPPSTIPIGHLSFPLYNPALHGEEDTQWMKRAYLFVGRHQRLTGEVKKLAKPVAVLRRRARGGEEDGGGMEGEALEIVEIVRWKVLFAQRPEPVGGGGSGGVGEEAGAGEETGLER